MCSQKQLCLNAYFRYIYAIGKVKIAQMSFLMVTQTVVCVYSRILFTNKKTRIT